MLAPVFLQVRDLASTMLDVVPDAPCTEDGVACTLRSLVDYLLAGSLVFGICLVMGVVFAVWFAVLAARLDAAGRKPSRRAKRLVSEPIHSDGTWVRLVEDERGDRVVEVLDGTDWHASARDLSQFLLDVPIGPRSRG